MAGGMVLMLAGVWLAAQVLKGDLLGRLQVLDGGSGPAAKNTSANATTPAASGAA